MNIDIVDIEEKQVKFVFVATEGTMSNVMSINPAYFDDVKKMAELNLNFNDVDSCSDLGLMPKHRLKLLSKQFTGFKSMNDNTDKMLMPMADLERAIATAATDRNKGFLEGILYARLSLRAAGVEE